MHSDINKCGPGLTRILTFTVVSVCVCLCQDEDVSADQPSMAAATAHPVAERLDSLMAVLMAYIKDVCHINGT